MSQGIDPYRAARERMVREQIEARGVSDPQVLHAMRVVPRHRFVPERLRDRAYTDRPLPIGFDQTISQPYVVAVMTEALRLKAGDRVLEVGGGSGYQAAVLAEVASEVHSVEVVEDLARAAHARLAELRYTNVHVHYADGSLGWPAAAPYAGILVACGAPVVPPPLLAQLAPGGRMVIPVGRAGHVMSLDLWTKDADGTLHDRSLMEVRFVPLITSTSVD